MVWVGITDSHCLHHTHSWVNASWILLNFRRFVCLCLLYETTGIPFFHVILHPKHVVHPFTYVVWLLKGLYISVWNKCGSGRNRKKKKKIISIYYLQLCLSKWIEFGILICVYYIAISVKSPCLCMSIVLSCLSELIRATGCNRTCYIYMPLCQWEILSQPKSVLNTTKFVLVFGGAHWRFGFCLSVYLHTHTHTHTHVSWAKESCLWVCLVCLRFCYLSI